MCYKPVITITNQIALPYHVTNISQVLGTINKKKKRDLLLILIVVLKISTN